MLRKTHASNLVSRRFDAYSIDCRASVRGAFPPGVTMSMIYFMAQHGVSLDATAVDDNPLQDDTKALFESDGLLRRRIERACT